MNRLWTIYKKLHQNGLRTVLLQFADYLWIKFYVISTKNINVYKFPKYDVIEIDNILSGIDVLIVPSVMRESYSLVTREALSRKVPVICSDSGGPEEIVRNGENGFVFITGDHNDLKEKIMRFIEQPSLLNEFINNIGKIHIPTVEEEAKELEKNYVSLAQHESIPN